jgi:KDO2-lipid IV(A) lauroyltransferase
MRAIAWAIARLPFSLLPPLGALIGWIAGSLVRIRRRHVEASMRRAGIPDARRVAARMYRSLGLGLCELLWLAGRPPGALGERFVMAPACAEALQRAASLGHGIVVVTAHTGNWDLAACAAARWLALEGGAPLGSRLHVVTKRLSWRALDAYWQHLRAEQGVVLVEAEGAAARVREALARGGTVALLIDQAPERSSGVATFPFLGAPALHDLGPALLAARARAPIVAIFGHRGADGRHRLELAESIQPEELRGGRGALLAATERIARALEREVRAHPEQWLWLHRRWKGARA